MLAFKACDRLDNLRSLMVDGTTIDFQKRQIKETEDIYYPIFDLLLQLTPEVYKNDISFIRDEIRKIVERNKVILEFKEGNK